MASSSAPHADLVSKALAFVETELDQALSVERIAGHVGLSPYHFCRLFTSYVGRGVMAHVRGRRLVKGARLLLEHPETRLVDLAFHCGFDSQEAFTRAFKRLFGVAPGRFRHGFAVEPIERQFAMTLPDPLPPDAAVVQLPEPVAIEAFEVAGFTRRFDENNKSDIPQLWARLLGKLPFPAQMPSRASYGVVWNVDRDSGSFLYLAGVAVKPDATLPEGFERKRIPAATYAVFRITLDGGPLPAQVRAAMQIIWGQLIPASGLAIADGPDFERYDGSVSPITPGATIDFHVPLRE